MIDAPATKQDLAELGRQLSAEIGSLRGKWSERLDGQISSLRQELAARDRKLRALIKDQAQELRQEWQADLHEALETQARELRVLIESESEQLRALFRESDVRPRVTKLEQRVAALEKRNRPLG